MGNNSVVVCGFPGVGKSTAFRQLNSEKVFDSDSSNFNEKDNPNNPFPSNYITYIKDKMLIDGAVIFVSTHEAVRSALIENRVSFFLVYPDSSCKAEYIQRYADRGSPQAFLDLLETYFSEWVQECDDVNDILITKIKLMPEENLHGALSQRNII